MQLTDCKNIPYQQIEKPNRMIDITNQSFGLLTPLFTVKRLDDIKGTFWLCKCQCGNLKIVSSSNLRDKKIRSCGCLRSENTRQHIVEINKKRKENLTNKIFGDLLVIRYDENTTQQHQLVSNSAPATHSYWLCQCLKCKKYISLRADTLKNPKFNFCRYCYPANSAGEIKIEKLLQQYKINYVKEKSFPTCIFPDTQRLARFDFYVDNKYLIEFDGAQHFKELENTHFNLIKIQEHDDIKNEWCLKNNVPLIRIPYSHLKDLKIEDILLETTQYRMECKNG